MALGDLTKQLAQQALQKAGTAPSPAAQPDNLCALILGQVQAMQKALKEDEELVAIYHAGTEAIRILEFFPVSWQLLVLTGHDSQRNLTRVISAPESLQLVCKVMKVQPPARPSRINFIAPKSKPE